MPSIKINNPTPVVEPTPVTVTEPIYKHALVSTKQIPYNALITHIQGASYVVDYYTQVLASSQQPQDYNPTQSGINQQYNCIEDMEMKLQSYDVSADDQTGEITVTGTAVVYPPLKPNKGDPFIADIGNGVVGQFTVTRVSQKYYFKTTTYEIDFILARIFDEQALIDALNHKVVETYKFVKDFLTYGQNPLLVREEFLALEDAQRTLTESIDDYVKEFLSRELSSFIVPDAPKATYDPFATKAFLTVVNGDDHPLIARVKELNVDELKEYYAFSVWNCLINPSTNRIQNVWRKAKPASIAEFNLYPRLGSLRYSGYQWCIKPIDDLANVDFYNGDAKRSQVGILDSLLGDNLYAGVKPINIACQLCTCNNHYHSHNEPVRSDCNHTIPCTCACHNPAPTTAPDYSYVLSDLFFDTTPGVKDEFEAIILAHLDLQAVDVGRIATLLKARRSWDRRTRYYRGLALIIVLIAALRRM